MNWRISVLDLTKKWTRSQKYPDEENRSQANGYPVWSETKNPVVSRLFSNPSVMQSLSPSQLTLLIHDQTYCVAKLLPQHWDCELLTLEGCENSFFSVSRTSDEVSIVCAQSSQSLRELSDRNAQLEKDWVLIQVEGQLEFDMVGVIAFFSNFSSFSRMKSSFHSWFFICTNWIWLVIF